MDTGDISGSLIAGRYRVLDVLGQGGLGTVYKAVDLRLGKTVAVKVLRASVEDIEAQERVFAEFSRQKQLAHPNLLRVHDLGESDGVLYITAEFIEGSSLQQILSGTERLDASRAFDIIRQVGAALEHIHHRGFVHRDVKPGNILVSSDGRAVLSDLGTAALLGASGLTDIGTVVGTPAYMSPEQANGGIVDARTDIFALAVVMYECLTGRRPVEAQTIAEQFKNLVQGAPLAPSRLNPEIPTELDRVLLNALAKNPEQRFPSVDIFVQALGRACSGNPAAVGSWSTKWPPRRYAVIFGIMIAGVLGSLSLSKWRTPASAGRADESFLLPLLSILLAAVVCWLLYRWVERRRVATAVISAPDAVAIHHTAEFVPADAESGWHTASAQSGLPAAIPEGDLLKRSAADADATRETYAHAEVSLPGDQHSLAWLLVLNGPLRGKQFRLTKGVVIGRSSSADLCVPGDSLLSRRHAIVTPNCGRFFIEDLGSKIGTIVNGIQVQRHELSDRDEIRMGGLTVLFINSAEHAGLTREGLSRQRRFESAWRELVRAARHE